jgi:RimJ/RimL family protein N-acetyltransferase
LPLESGGALIVHDAASRAVIGSSRHNGELKRLMLEHAFQFFESVILYVSPTNIRSRRAVQKVGGIREPARDQPERLCYRIRPAQ